jgi:hypothetical protein
MRDVLIGILPVLGVALGALLQHFLARSKERESQLTTIRHQTYADYLRGVSAVAMSRTAGSLSRLIDAKSRMAIYASNDVIERLERFEIAGANLANPKAVDAFVKMASQMRAESGHVDTNAAALSAVLFGVERHPVRSGT